MKKFFLINIILIVFSLLIFVACDSSEESAKNEKTSDLETEEVEETTTVILQEQSQIQVTVCETQAQTQPETWDIYWEARNNKTNNSAYLQQVTNYVNQYRAEVGAMPLVLSDELCLAASVRATEMLTNNYFDHVRPDGRLWSTIFSDMGIGYSYCGENIAYGFSDAASACSAWRVSTAGHYENMIKPEYGKIGVGIAFESDGSGYWVQLFTN